jgi:hypothetical protein
MESYVNIDWTVLVSPCQHAWHCLAQGVRNKTHWAVFRSQMSFLTHNLPPHTGNFDGLIEIKLMAFQTKVAKCYRTANGDEPILKKEVLILCNMKMKFDARRYIFIFFYLKFYFIVALGLFLRRFIDGV